MLHFIPYDLFPPDWKGSGTTQPFTASSVALSGPLPHSSLFHLALNHLRSTTTSTARQHDDIQAEGTPTRHVLILTGSRNDLIDGLQFERDNSLYAELEDGTEFLSLLSGIEIKYLETPAHLKYFLSALFSFHKTRTPPVASGQSPHSAKSDPLYIARWPSMVVLHNPGAYISESQLESGGIEVYGSILALFTSTFATSPDSTLDLPLLVLHDSLASTLEMPAVSDARAKTTTGAPKTSPTVALEALFPHFFDWTGKSTLMPFSPSVVFGPEFARYSVTFKRSGLRVFSDDVDGGRARKGEAREVSIEYMTERIEGRAGAPDSTKISVIHSH
ncbi:hypothetical protein T439DRAFT_377305 [Meredithblackwellia eburnea MCA 4105]